MDLDALFDALDLDADGEVSRTELNEAAAAMRWSWREAPLLAVLDLLTLDAALDRASFAFSMSTMAADPLGPFGRILQHIRYPDPAELALDDQREVETCGVACEAALITFLSCAVGAGAAAAYASLLDGLEPGSELSRDEGALLIIDPQRSFTSGSWMRSIGSDAEVEVEPIRLAFEQCARSIAGRRVPAETMFTRCPFPPGSYEWDDRIAAVLREDQRYFLKPGNSVLWPPTNGFAEWAGKHLHRGKRTLVIGGCTLNSCVRVSAIEAKQRFPGLSVVVDLSLCGARARNYVRSASFQGLSSVEFAVVQMREAGVEVTREVAWKSRDT